MSVRGRRTQRGASAIELSIVAPFFLMLIFSLIQGSLWLYARNVALSAAREGASDARLFQPDEYTAGVDAGLKQQLVSYVATVGNNTLVDTKPEIDYNPGGSGRVTVTVTGHAIGLTPFDLEVRRSVEMEIEQFEPDLGQ
ncbi:MAG: pilus assembly protein [Propionibacteriales bacterium]|nr:pilus assembly protein [Propionibacteriales bacterium]